jgi:hypothetical protein
MGPGYFPAILSWLMVGLGAVMAGLAWRAPHQEGVFGVVPWRALVLIVGATLFFGRPGGRTERSLSSDL